MKYVKITFAILLALSTIYLWIQNKRLKEEILNKDGSLKTDTIYIPKSYERPEDLKMESKPEKVEIYQPPLETSLYNTPSSYTVYSANIQDSIISLSLSEDILKIDALVNDTSYQRKTFSLDPLLFQYRYQNGRLTKQKLPFRKRIKPYAELSYRPLNNFLDLNSGLAFKTRIFNYKLGINISYYPNLSSKVYKDVVFSLTYNF